MKNIVIDNQEFQVSPNKTKLEVQIAELQSQEWQITKQLKVWQSKLKKANNLANCLWSANKFGTKFLTELAESEKNQESDNLWWEHLISNKFKRFSMPAVSSISYWGGYSTKELSALSEWLCQWDYPRLC